MVTKKIELRKIFELPWDHDDDGEVNDMKKYMEMMHRIEQKLNKKD